MDESLFDNQYVQTALPLAMGITAASSPAGARGSQALLSTLGALQASTQSKRKLEADVRKEKRPQVILAGEDRTPHLFHPDTGKIEAADMPGDQPALRQQARDFTQSYIRGGPGGTGAAPGPTTPQNIPPVAPGPAQQGDINARLRDVSATATLPPAVDAGVRQAEQNYLGAHPQEENATQQRLREATSALPREQQVALPPDLQRAYQLANTPEGAWLVAAGGGRKSLQQYTEARAKERMEVPQAVAKETAIQPLMLDRAYQQGLGTAEINMDLAQRKQALEQRTFRMTEPQQRAMASLNESLGLVESMDDFTKQEIDSWTGVMKNTGKQWAQLVQEDPRFAAFDARLGKLKASFLFSRTEGGGAALTKTEEAQLLQSIPTGKELGGGPQFRAKMRMMQGLLTRRMNTTIGLATQQPGKGGLDAFLTAQRKQLREELAITGTGAGEDAGTDSNATPTAPPVQSPETLMLKNMSPKARAVYEQLKRGPAR